MCIRDRLDGTRSDHNIIAAAFRLPKQKKGAAVEFKFRPITKKGTELFKAGLLEVDWQIIERDTSTGSASALNDLLTELFNNCFEEKTRRYKSTDAPWFNKRIKRLVSRKRRIYRQEGKSLRYKNAKAECEAEIKLAKKKYLSLIHI